MRQRLIVVGGGILGAMHAWHGRKRGYEVVHLEREVAARGASVRNFGLVWVSGRAPGPELSLALRARELWDEVAVDVPAVALRTGGSMTVAVNDDEWRVIQQAVELPDAHLRGFHLLDPEEVRDRNPGLGGKLNGALWCDRDALVEPRLASAAIVARLSDDPDYVWRPACTVVDVKDGSVRDDEGLWWDGDLVVVCPGASHSGPFAEWLRTGVRRVRLQMMQTAPLEATLTTSIADADSLRYYPAYAGLDLGALPPQPPVAAECGLQLLMAQRVDGSLTIGDTHGYDEPFSFDVEEPPYDELYSRASAIIGPGMPRVVRRWAGVYSQTTDERIYARHDLADRVVLVTGAGGRGMTCSPAIAEETFEGIE
ncbi:MAG TPA: TIGR03364 family FAD-dependent oxidoreductase [Mycobacteriales bacterium]|nr:TIGR03364 family FAD-dependent oxidoreductase [Mycobacteriales bacterium]